MRPGGFVDLCEHCVKVLDERDLESEKYKTVRAVNNFISLQLIFILSLPITMRNMMNKLI